MTFCTAASSSFSTAGVSFWTCPGAVDPESEGEGGSVARMTEAELGPADAEAGVANADPPAIGTASVPTAAAVTAPLRNPRVECVMS
jgi:hypothetical protein